MCAVEIPAAWRPSRSSGDVCATKPIQTCRTAHARCTCPSRVYIKHKRAVELGDAVHVYVPYLARLWHFYVCARNHSDFLYSAIFFLARMYMWIRSCSSQSDARGHGAHTCAINSWYTLDWRATTQRPNIIIVLPHHPVRVKSSRVENS